MWHGNYIRWLEEVRVRYLSHRGLPYDELVSVCHTELVVRDVAIRYISPARLGDTIEVTIRLKNEKNKVRLTIFSEFIRQSDKQLCASANIIVVPIDTETGKVRRVWPEPLKKALLQ